MIHRKLSPLARLALGGLAGCLATAPMSVCMLAGKQAFTRLRRKPLPPTQITHNALCALGLRQRSDTHGIKGLTTANHFAYGAAVGAIYGLHADDKRQPTSYAMGQGVGFGLGVWTVSYLAWLPAVGLYRMATREPMERNALMIGAHVVWGAALGLFFEQLAERQLTRARWGDASSVKPPATAVAENLVGI